MKNAFTKEKKIFICSLILVITGFICFGANGDVNNSGSIDINDALMVARYSAGLAVSGFNAANADTNCDNTVNINDALVIARFSASLATICPGTTATPTPTPTPTITRVIASQVVFIGDSVIALSKQIPADLNTLARNAGVIGSSESFRDYSVSGMRMDGGGTPTIPQQYANAKAAGTVKYVIMDGGGNDCLQAGCSSPITSSCQALVNARNAFQTLLRQMATDGVKAVIFMRYYNAPSDPREALTVLMPMMEAVATATTNPKVYWIDMRPLLTSSDIASDGLHPSPSGCQKMADAVWSTIKQNNVFAQ